MWPSPDDQFVSPVHEIALTTEGCRLPALHIETEIPPPHGSWLQVVVVLGNHEAEPDVGVSGCPVRIGQKLFGACLQIDDAVVFTVAAVDVLLDHQPAAALVDLALVEVTLLRKVRGRRVTSL